MSNNNNISAVVEHNYIQKEPDELSLTKGETVFEIVKLSEGWWQGVNSAGKKGMFPENFVRIVDDSEVTLRDKHATVQRKCKAIYSYDQNKEDELTLAVGDIVEILGEAEEGWWQGQLNGKKGVFPSNFVTLIDLSATQEKKCDLSENIPKENIKTSKTIIKSEINHSEVPSLPPKRQKEFCQVEFAYTPQNEDELELNVGDIITIVSKEAQDVGWWKGEINGKIGVFPDNFVKLLPLEGISKSTSSSKIYIKSDQKSFGSKDSLKEILNETGLQIGNVVQQRLSLEHKNLDFSNGINESNVLKASNENELRKSLELSDDKKIVPPTLPKKPTIPVKKTGSVTSVAGNIISGIKKSVKSVEQKLQTTSTHDSADGLSSSKLVITDNFNKNVKIEKIKLQEDFDNVERTTSMLQDVRAGRVKAPKRRPPTATTTTGNENNNYINGISYNENVEVVRSQVYIKTEKEENNRISKNIPAKMNAPWMAELKANQERKKISPNKETTGTNINTNEEGSSVRSVLVKERIVATESSSSRSVIATATLDNQKVQNLVIAEKEKGTQSTVLMAPKQNISSLQKTEKNDANGEGSSNILTQNNNSIDINSKVDSECTNNKRISELEKRVQQLECIVEQLRQELLLLKNFNENHSSAKVVKSEIEKYV